MKAKEFIKLFIPPIYYKIKYRLEKLMLKPAIPLPKIVHDKQRMVVIGTGPSLNKTMELYGDRLGDYDCLMVNFSARTPLYEKIRPQYYMMADPGFLHNQNVRESVDKLVVDIRNKTTWPMTVVMSDRLKLWDGGARMSQNKNITVLYYSTKWTEAKNKELFRVWDKNKGYPPAQTVLTTCVWFSIYQGYKETYLVGADTSFIQDIYVGQNDNVLYTIDRHYYQNQDVCPSELEKEKGGRKFDTDMEGILSDVHTMFKEYKLLKRYAEWKGVSIYNASEYSMIDCFERKKLNE